MKAIVCVDKKWGIGKDNDLLFSLPQDMKFFRATTLDKVVVMGGNTLRSFPNGKPLPKRVNVVLSKREEREDVIICRDLDSLFLELKKYDLDDVYVIGGGSFYKTMLPYCDKALVTKVDADKEADIYFPNLDKEDGWKMIKQSGEIEDNGYKIVFTEYQNEKRIDF